MRRCEAAPPQWHCTRPLAPASGPVVRSTCAGHPQRAPRVPWWCGGEVATIIGLTSPARRLTAPSQITYGHSRLKRALDSTFRDRLGRPKRPGRTQHTSKRPQTAWRRLWRDWRPFLATCWTGNGLSMATTQARGMPPRPSRPGTPMRHDPHVESIARVISVFVINKNERSPAAIAYACMWNAKVCHDLLL